MMHILLGNIFHPSYQGEAMEDAMENDLVEVIERAGFVIGEVVVNPKLPKGGVF